MSALWPLRSAHDRLGCPAVAPGHGRVGRCADAAEHGSSVVEDGNSVDGPCTRACSSALVPRWDSVAVGERAARHRRGSDGVEVRAGGTRPGTARGVGRAVKRNPAHRLRSLSVSPSPSPHASACNPLASRGHDRAASLGSTSWGMCSTSCPSGSSPRRNEPFTRSWTPTPESRRTNSWRPSSRRTRRSTPRRRRVWSTTASGCSPSSPSRRNHWTHLRTTNVIESPFATVRLRQRVTKGAGSRTKGLLMAYKLLDMAQRRWRRLNSAHLLPLVRAGVPFIDGLQQERDTKEKNRKEAA